MVSSSDSLATAATTPAIQWSPQEDAVRAEAAIWLRQSWQEGVAEVMAALANHASGKRSMRELSARMDTMLTGLWHMASRLFEPMPLALIAVGGYGRRELFLHSDVDLLLLQPAEGAPSAQRATQWLLYALWDAGIKVSHQVGTGDELLALAARDLSWRTSMLDARRIAARSGLRRTLLKRLHEEVIEPNMLDFVEAKMAERDARHKRWGGSRYMLEPNIKDGKGGLRDLQTLYWLAKATHRIKHIRELAEHGLLTQAEVRGYIRAVEFFSTVRMHLHALTGRAEDRLTFEHQRALAATLGFRGSTPNAMVERFMKRYFLLTRSVGRLTRAVCTALEEEKKRKPKGMLAAQDARALPQLPFVLEGERVGFADGDAVAENPTQMVLLFQEALRTGRDIHPHALQLVARHAAKLRPPMMREPAVAQAFFTMLTAPDAEIHLRRMNDAELLPRIIPEFRHVVGQMQFDRYHTYTVDEHIFVAIAKLHAIAQGNYTELLPLASDVVRDFRGSRVLFFAMLCHDIAKGRGGNHPALGATIARKHAEKLGMDSTEQGHVAWLVEHHQLLTDVAFKRDLQDPQVIRQLAEQIQSAHRLRMLLLMTVADILAVGPQVWNGWKGTILRELYRKVEALIMQGQLLPMRSSESTPERMRRLMPELEEDQVQAIASLADENYWQALGNRALVRAVHILLAEAVPPEAYEEVSIPAPVLHWHPEPKEGVSELWVRVADQPGLFAHIAGSLSAGGANIVRCQIHTLSDGTALDRFWVQNRQGQAFEEEHAQARVAELLTEALAGTLSLPPLLDRARRAYGKRMQLYDARPDVYLDAHASATHTVLEVRAADRIGLLYDITTALAGERVNVARAYISTYGEEAVDVFYLKNHYGLKIEHPARLQALELAVLHAVQPQKEQ
jgi:[protein-PII] uridylyltransferase